MSNFKTATRLKARFPTKQGTVRILKTKKFERDEQQNKSVRANLLMNLSR